MPRNKVRAYDMGPAALEELVPGDPTQTHYRRGGFSRLRVDGNWYRCHLCIYTAPCQGYMTAYKHFQKFHGFEVEKKDENAPNSLSNIRRRLHVVSRAEGERLKRVLLDWQIGERRADRKDTPFDDNCVPHNGAMPLPTAPLNLQGLAPAPAMIYPAAVLAANDPTAIAAAAIVANAAAANAPAANVPPVPAAPALVAPPGNANNQQRSLNRYMCYICKQLFSSKAYVKTHALTIHATRLIQEPFQPGRVPVVEIDAVTKQPVKLVQEGRRQKPSFLLVCEELRELFYKELLTIPTAMDLRRDYEYDMRIFRVFALNKSIAAQTMPLFSKWNFLIQISISSYEEDDLDIFERTLAHDQQVVPSNLAPSLGQPALSLSLQLITRHATSRRTMRRVEALVIYTERGLIDLVEQINRYVGRLRSLKVDFAPYASAERFGSIKRMTEQYLGCLRNIPRLLWYDSGSLINDTVIQRMRLVETGHPGEREEEMTRDLRRLTITLQEQIRRRMVGPACMTENWLINCLEAVPVLSRERMLGPGEGTDRSRRLQCARKELLGDILLAQLQLLEFTEQRETNSEVQNFRDTYLVFKSVKSRMFKFPGVPDSFRADAHLHLGILASRIARNMLDFCNKEYQWIIADSLDIDFRDVTNGDYGRLLVGGGVNGYDSDAGSDSDEESMDDDGSEQSEESEDASNDEDNSSGSDADSEASESTRRSQSHSILESRPTHDMLWGSRDPDAASNTSGQTLPGSRRFSGSDANDLSAHDTAMEGVPQGSLSNFGDRSALSSMAPAWYDGDAMEDVQHSEPGSNSEHSADEDMEDIQQSAIPFLNDTIPSSDGENSADEDGYDTDNMSTATESTVRPRRRRPVDNGAAASETSTYVPTPDVHKLGPPVEWGGGRRSRHRELREDKLVTPPMSKTAPAVLARFALHHFYYADVLYLDIRNGQANNSVTTTPINPNDPIELPGEKHIDKICKAFDHELDWDEDMPARTIEVRYGHGMHKPFEWVGAPALAEHWDMKYGPGVAFECMAEWQKRPVGWEEECEEMRKEIGRALDEIVEMAKKEGRM